MLRIVAPSSMGISATIGPGSQRKRRRQFWFHNAPEMEEDSTKPVIAHGT